jgi:hypothetical protein
LALLVCANIGWASVSACSTTAGGALINSFGTVATATNGCAYVDKSFSDFTLTHTGAAGANWAVNPPSDTGSTTFITAAGSTSSLAKLDFLDSNWSVNHSTGDSFTNNMVVQAHGVGTAGASFNGYNYTNGSNGYVDAGTGKQWDITSIVVDLSAARITTLGANATNNLVITTAFCIGNTALGTTGVCAPNGGAEYGFIQIQANTTGSGAVTSYTLSCENLGGATGSAANCGAGQFSNTGTTAAGGVVTFLLPVHNLGLSIFTTVSLNRTSGSGTTVTLHDYQLDFGEAAESPEPATSGLIGVSLAGLAFLGYRRRRKSQQP